MTADSPKSLAPDQDGLPSPRRYWAILSITFGVFLAVMQTNVVQVALPTIAESFQVSASSAVWIVTASQLAISASLFPFAALGERIGYRQVYCGGLAICVCTALICATSDNLVQLVAARTAQGFGIAAVMAVNLALVRFIFPRRLLGLGIGYSTFVVALSSTVGPSIAGAILAFGGWRWLFLLDLPVGIAVLPIALASLPRTPLGARRFDALGALLVAVSFTVVVITVDVSGGGAPAWVVSISVPACALVVSALILHQRRQAQPILPIDLLAVPIVRLSTLTSAASYMVQGLSFVTLPFYLQDELRLTPAWVGLAMGPWPLGVAIAAPLAGWLTSRYAPGLLCTIGLFVLMCGLGLLLMLGEEPSFADIALRMLVCGIGFGIFQSPNSVAIMSSVPAKRAASAGAIQSAGRLFGQTFGVAIAGIVLGAAANAIDIALLTAIACTALAAIFSAMRGIS